MTTVHPILYSRTNKEGKYPLAIRITKNRKYSLVFLGQAIKKTEWDKNARKVKRNHKNSVRLNAFIAKRVSQINDELLAMEMQGDETTAQVVHKKIANRKSNNDFFSVAELYLEKLKTHGNRNQHDADKPRIQRVRDFIKSDHLPLKNITVSFLDQFSAFLKGTRNVGKRTIMNHLVVIRTIYNMAIKNSLIDRKHYPFGKGKIQIQFPDSVKIGLTKEQVQGLEQLELLSHPKEHHARNIWLYSFYFAGMRASDVFRTRWSDIVDGRLHYQMGKNKKVLSLSFPDKAFAIIEQYTEQKRSQDDFVFPELKPWKNSTDTYLLQQKISNAIKINNKYLKRIANKLNLPIPLTMHIARHTFGNIAGDKIPIQMLQKLYRHSSVLTTIGYQSNFMFKDTDEALNAVIE